jgi:uncharacterized membrane protein
MAETQTGLKENVACLLCYVLGWISGIVFLIIEPNNKTIKYHAYQSILVFATITAASMIFDWIPYVGYYFFRWAIGLTAFILWLVLMISAYQEKKIKISIAGQYAEKWSA